MKSIREPTVNIVSKNKTNGVLKTAVAVLALSISAITAAQSEECTEPYGAKILYVDWVFFNCGLPSTVTVTVRNTGTLDWQRIIDPSQGPGDVGFKLGMNPPDFPHQSAIDGPARTQLDEDEVVSCGEEKDFVFSVTPDQSLSGYQEFALVFQMVDEWDQWFGQIFYTDAIVQCNGETCDGNEWDSDLSWAVQPPASLECGQSFEAQVSAQNIGTRDWHPLDGVEIAAYEGGDRFDVDPVSVPGGAGVECDTGITFTLPIRAPEVSSAQTFSLTPQMRRNGNIWFGDTTLTRDIEVSCDGGTLPPPQAGDDIVSVCDDRPAIVDVLANDVSGTGFEAAVSLQSSACAGPITHLGDGIFDVTGALMAAPSCNFQYQLAESTVTTDARVTLKRDFFCSATGATPLLTLLEGNPRYFSGDNLTATYLAGAHVWQNLQDYGPNPVPTTCGDESPPHGCGAEEWDFLRFRGNNFTRGWVWEQEQGFAGAGIEGYQVRPMPYLKNGAGNYDLTQFNNAYFSRLRGRIQSAADRGLYISVMLFQGWSHQQRRSGGDNPWLGHPFHPNNNITFNGYNLDLNGNGTGEEMHTLNIDPQVTAVQKAYIDRYIQELNGFDNIIWEICNECGDITNNIPVSDTFAWMNDMVEHIKQTELDNYPKQHLVWISAPWGSSSSPGSINAALLDGPADIVALAPNQGWKTDPPLYTPTPGNEKAVLFDTDHGLNCGGANNDSWCSVEWPWKMFLRGYNTALMDVVRTLLPVDGDNSNPGFDQVIEETRLGLGQTVHFASSVIRTLAAMAPDLALSSTGYALVNPGVEYLVFQPDAGSFTVFMEQGEYDYQWFDIRGGSGAGTVVESGSISVTEPADQTFQRDGQDWVLYLVNPTTIPGQIEPVISLTATPETIESGQSSLLEWNVMFAAPGSCAGFVNGEELSAPLVLPSGSFLDMPTETTVYRIECQWTKGVAVASVTVTVNQPTNLLAIDDPDPGDTSLTFTTHQPTYEILFDLLFANDSPSTGITIANFTTPPVADGTLLSLPGASPPQFEFTPVSDHPGGNVVFTYSMTDDGTRESNVATVTMTIPAPPSPLIAHPDPDASDPNELTFPTHFSVYTFSHNLLLDNDESTDPDITNFWIQDFDHPVDVNGNLVGSLDISGGAQTDFSFHSFGFPGGDVIFNYRIRDEANHLSNYTSVTLTIPNAPDTLVANDDNVVFETHAGLYTIFFTDLLNNDSPSQGVSIELDGFTDPVAVSVPGIPPGIQVGTLEITGHLPANFAYMPPADFPGGVISFTYQTSNGQIDSNWATVTVTIPPLPVVATNDVLPMGTLQTEYEILHAALTANDTGPATGFHISAITQPGIGGVLTNNSGATPPTLTYTPDADFLGGAVSFSYTITDGVTSSTANVNMWVIHAVDDGPLPIQGCGPMDVFVLDNDNGAFLRIVSTTQPVNGTVTFAGRIVTFEGPPDMVFGDTATFTYTANDTFNQSSTATVSLFSQCDVGPPALQANDDAVTLNDVPAHGFIGFGHSHVLANDLPAPPEIWVHEPSVTQPSAGIITTIPGVDPPKFRYTPPDDFLGGQVTFDYAITNGVSISTPATVTLTVNMNWPPISASDDGYYVPRGTVGLRMPISQVVSNDSADPTTTVTAVGTPNYGRVFIEGEDLVYYPDDAFWRNEYDEFTYIITSTLQGTVISTASVRLTNQGICRPVSSADMDTGDLSQWDLLILTGGTLSAEDYAALSGRYGMAVNVQTNSALYAESSTVPGDDHLWIEFEFDPNSVIMNLSPNHVLFKNVGLGNTINDMQFRRRSNGEYAIRLRTYRDDGSRINGPWLAISDDPQHIRIEWKAGASSTGEVRLWVNNHLSFESLGLDNDTLLIEQHRVGAVQGNFSGTVGEFYLDTFASCKPD